MNLATLPPDHPLRNRPLAEIGALKALIPEGWVPVPKQPTPIMIACAQSNWSGFCKDGPNAMDHAAERLYTAMLAKAPKPGSLP